MIHLKTASLFAGNCLRCKHSWPVLSLSSLKDCAGLLESKLYVSTTVQRNEVSKQAGVVEEDAKTEFPVLLTEAEKVVFVERRKNLFLKGQLPSLICYVDICIQNNVPLLAHRVLLDHYKQTSISLEPQVVDICNVILHGWAKKMNYPRLKHLLNLMEREGPLPTLQSYAAAIECAVRAGGKKHEIKRHLSKIKQMGLDVHDLLVKCKFVKDEAEKVVMGIRMVLPFFSPKPVSLNTAYQCNLLQELNSAPPSKAPLQFQSLLERGLDVNRLKELATTQVEREIQGYVTIKSIFSNEEKYHETKEWEEVIKECESKWRTTLKDVFVKDLSALKALTKELKLRHMAHFYPYMTAMPVDIYIDYVMQEVRSLACKSFTGRCLMSDVQKSLGEKVMERYFIETKRRNGVLDKMILLYNEFCQYYGSPDTMSKQNPRQYWQTLHNIYCRGVNFDNGQNLWPENVQESVGQFLTKLFLVNLEIDVNILNPDEKTQKLEPAFFSIFRKEIQIVNFESLVVNPALEQLYSQAYSKHLSIAARYFPMTSPPRPWCSIHNGGYAVSSSQFVHGSGNTMTKYFLESADQKNLYPAFDALNQHAECPWKINQRVLDPMIKTFSKMGTLEVELVHNSLISSRPQCEQIPGKTPMKVKDMSLNKRKKLCRNAFRNLSIAHQLRDEVFWLPGHLDFRGRFNPFFGSLHYRESDAASALLMFAKGEKLGSQGLKWLKIHLANLTGSVKRTSFEERLQYCDENLSHIMDSVDNPLEGQRWWMRSEKPWQTLACCIELASVLRSPSPEDYVCHLPVHQDAPSNVLQHYAALGRDTEGAKQTNLFPMDAQQDAYAKIVELVDAECMKDAANGCDIARHMQGLLSRKIAKDAVMQRVYGYSSRNIVGIVSSCFHELPSFPHKLRMRGADYLATKTLCAIDHVFSYGMRIKDWFAESSKLLARECRQSVKWTTPLGFPVYQPYFKIKEIEHVKENEPEEEKVIFTKEIPDGSKHRNAFPANYIASLESSHLMLTSIFCQRAGIPLASFHDSYWTIPSDVDVMRAICREQFVALHSEPILHDLSECFLKTQKEGVSLGKDDPSITEFISTVPERGSFDLQLVLNSKYFIC